MLMCRDTKHLFEYARVTKIIIITIIIIIIIIITG